MINQELLRKSLREHIQWETDGNVLKWCTHGDPQLPQGTVAGFLSGYRDAGRDLLIKLCARMRLEPQNFYKSKTPDVLKGRLGMLSRLIVHPQFPFDNNASFEALAAHIETLYSHCMKNEDD